MDSEILLRMAEKNLTISGIEPLGFVDDISRCRGKLSAVVVATNDPTKVLLVKGNQPLEVRHHEARGLIAYASEPEILRAAIGLESGWTTIDIPNWRLVRVDTRQLLPLRAYLIPRRRTGEDERSHPCR